MHYETNKVMMQHEVKSMQKKMKTKKDREVEIQDELADEEKKLTKTSE